jgi:hypothetical protein
VSSRWRGATYSASIRWWSNATWPRGESKWRENHPSGVGGSFGCRCFLRRRGRTQVPVLSWWGGWCSTDPHSRQCFTESSRPWLMTTVLQPERSSRMYSPFYRGKAIDILRSFAAGIAQGSRRGAERLLRGPPAGGDLQVTTESQDPTERRVGRRMPTGPLSDCPSTSSRGKKPLLSSMEWRTAMWNSTASYAPRSPSVEPP